MNFQLVIFDWAGTLVDFGCCAPLSAFLEAFSAAGLPLSEEVARRPMGAHKRDHVSEILGYPEVAARVRRELGRAPDEALGAEIYEGFRQRLPDALRRHATPIPGAVETLQWLRQCGLHIGSTTGYTREMMDVLEPSARAAGLLTDMLVCSDEVPRGPAPWACFRIAERFDVYPMSRCLKIGDTPVDMAEGRNAGMLALAVSASGNEVGLSQAALEGLSKAERTARIEAAERRLRTAGAADVLRSVADLPAWIERQAKASPLHPSVGQD